MVASAEIKSASAASKEGGILGFDGENRFLSNYWSSPVVAYGITFPTVEHAFAAAKIDPKDPRRNTQGALDEMKLIAAAHSPGQAKKLGRKTLLRTDWEAVKFDMITELVRRKFQDPALAEKLLATGDAELYELNTWNDRIWGVVEINDGLFGTNWLGQILMTVRNELKEN